MADFDQSIDQATERLRAFSEGPLEDAASTLEQRFEAAGARIEAALEKAARSGQLDFERMSEAILRDLARIAAERVLGGISAGGGSTVNVNLPQGGAGDARGIFASRNAIAAAVTAAASSGGRFQ